MWYQPAECSLYFHMIFFGYWKENLTRFTAIVVDDVDNTHTHTMWAHEGYSIGEHTSFVLSHQHPMFTPLYTVSGVKWINTKSARASSHGEKDTRISDSIVEQTETTRAEELHFSVAINVKNKKMVFLFSRPKIDFLTNSNATSRSIRSFSIFMFVGHEKWFQTMSVLGEFLA